MDCFSDRAEIRKGDLVRLRKDLYPYSCRLLWRVSGLRTRHLVTVQAEMPMVTVHRVNEFGAKSSIDIDAPACDYELAE